jgi:hypothetical protein
LIHAIIENPLERGKLFSVAIFVEILDKKGKPVTDYEREEYINEQNVNISILY